MSGPAPVRRSEALPADYPQFLTEIKARIAAARTRATLAVNTELISLYWEIGHEILDREQREGWGAKVINRLAADLRREFPDMTGLSLRNLRYMRAFARAWPAESPSSIVQQPAAQLPWGHNVTLLDKLDDSAGRLWYASQAVENGWSRKVLQAQIATDLRGRRDNALTSFDHALPAPDSELGRDAIDELERRAGDEPSIGLVLCPGRSKTVTEWALRTIAAPVAVARYTTDEITLTQTPPPEMKPVLPDLPALASELSNIVEAANSVNADDSAALDRAVGTEMRPKSQSTVVALHSHPGVSACAAGAPIASTGTRAANPATNTRARTISLLTQSAILARAPPRSCPRPVGEVYGAGFEGHELDHRVLKTGPGVCYSYGVSGSISRRELNAIEAPATLGPRISRGPSFCHSTSGRPAVSGRGSGRAGPVRIRCSNGPERFNQTRSLVLESTHRTIAETDHIASPLGMISSGRSVLKSQRPPEGGLASPPPKRTEGVSPL